MDGFVDAFNKDIFSHLGIKISDEDITTHNLIYRPTKLNNIQIGFAKYYYTPKNKISKKAEKLIINIPVPADEKRNNEKGYFSEISIKFLKSKNDDIKNHIKSLLKEEYNKPKGGSFAYLTVSKGSGASKQYKVIQE